MSVQTLALLTTLGAILTLSLNYAIGMCMLERPIVVGAVIGILLGDIPTGVAVGAALEVAFMGIVNIGGVTATDAGTSTAIATAFAIYSGLPLEETIAVAIPIGLAANALNGLTGSIINLSAPVLDKVVESGNQKKLYIYEFVMWLVVFMRKPFVVFVGVLAGAEPITQLLAGIPPVISTALNSASGLLGAVGMAMLMRMLWSKEIAVFYFLGFVLVNYFGIPTMGIAAVGVVIAVAYGLREMQIVNLEKKLAGGAGSAVAQVSEEEEFLA